MSTEIVLVGIEVRMAGNRAVPRVAMEIGDLGLSQVAWDLKHMAKEHPKQLFHHFDEEMRHQFLVRDYKFLREMLESDAYFDGRREAWQEAITTIEAYPHLTWWIHIED